MNNTDSIFKSLFNKKKIDRNVILRKHLSYKNSNEKEVIDKQSKKISYNSKVSNNFTVMDFVTMILKQNNMELLEEICTKKNLDYMERKELFDNFWKVSHYTPVIVNSIDDETFQYHLMIRRRKKIINKLNKKNVIISDNDVVIRKKNKHNT